MSGPSKIPPFPEVPVGSRLSHGHSARNMASEPITPGALIFGRGNSPAQGYRDSPCSVIHHAQKEVTGLDGLTDCSELSGVMSAPSRRSGTRDERRQIVRREHP